MAGEQVNKTGIVIPVSMARLIRDPKRIGNCIDVSLSGSQLSPITFAWNNGYTVFFKANVRSTPANAARIIDNNNGNLIMFSVTGVVVQHNGTQFSSGAILILNEWHDYAIMYDGTFIRWYRNGVCVATILCTVAPQPETYLYNLLNRNDGLRYCDVQMAYFQWFNRIFQPEEILSHYRSDPDGLSGCEFSYDMQEGTGTDIADTSGNSRNTSLVNGTWSTFNLPRSEVLYRQ